MILNETLRRAEPSWSQLQATERNGRFIGAHSSRSTIKGTTNYKVNIFHRGPKWENLPTWSVVFLPRDCHPPIKAYVTASVPFGRRRCVDFMGMIKNKVFDFTSQHSRCFYDLAMPLAYSCSVLKHCFLAWLPFVQCPVKPFRHDTIESEEQEKWTEDVDVV